MHSDCIIDERIGCDAFRSFDRNRSKMGFLAHEYVPTVYHFTWDFCQFLIPVQLWLRIGDVLLSSFAPQLTAAPIWSCQFNKSFLCWLIFMLYASSGHRDRQKRAAKTSVPSTVTIRFPIGYRHSNSNKQIIWHVRCQTHCRMRIHHNSNLCCLFNSRFAI